MQIPLIVAGAAVMTTVLIQARIQRGSNKQQKATAWVVLGTALIYLTYTLMRGH